MIRYLRSSTILLLSLILFNFFLLIVYTPDYCFADEDRTVYATGMADGTGAAARDRAIDDAMRRAVEQAMGSFVSSETLVENMILVEDRIYSETKGYIKRYEVKKEKSENGTYVVEIEAVVRTGKLADDLQSIGLLMRKKRNPRVMVIVYSREVSGHIFEATREGNRTIENRIESVMASRGFQIVDAGLMKRKMRVQEALMGGDVRSAGRTARDLGAEVLVIGDIRREYVDTRRMYGMNVRFYSNEIRLKAIETDTARVLYSGSAERPPSGVDYMEPLQEAASELVEQMISGILNRWSSDVYQAATYELNVAGASYRDVTALKKALKDIRGFGGVNTRKFQKGMAVLEIRYKGSLEELADAVSGLDRPPLEITGMRANTLDITIRPTGTE
jgi:hypothetical protein